MKPDTLAGMPVFRDGDKVYIINTQSITTDYMKTSADRLGMMFNNYRCPFSFLYEFEKWWEWKIRELSDKEETGSIMYSMISDPKKAEEFKIEPRMVVRHRFDFDTIMQHERRLMLSSCF